MIKKRQIIFLSFSLKTLNPVSWNTVWSLDDLESTQNYHINIYGDNMSKELVKCPICNTERIIIRQHEAHPNTTKFWCGKCNKTVEPIKK